MDRVKVRPDIMELIQIVSEAQGMKNHRIVDVKTNAKGEGYLGEIFMVTVAGDNGKKNLDLVIKSAFKEDKIRQLAPIRMSFENETYFYSEVYPEFKKFEAEKGVKSEGELVPKCLAVSLDDQSEMLVMENLLAKGFEVFDKKSILDHDHVKLIFKTYGRFHAYSFAMKDQRHEEYQRLTSKLQDVYAWFTAENMFRVNMIGLCEIVENLLVPGEDDKLIKAMGKLKGDKVVDAFAEAKTLDCRYSAILHGDCWSNNMMFKYEQLGDKKRPADVRLLDFQLMKVGSPVCDLSYFLYSGASKEVYDKLDDYLKLYYESFSSSLNALGSDPVKLFPFKELKEDWKMYSKFGFIMGIMILKMKLTNKEDLIDLTDDFESLDEDVFVKLKFDEEGYSSRVRELLNHLVEIGAL